MALRKIEAQHDRLPNQPAVRQGRGMALESPQGAQIAQLEAMFGSSPQTGRLARLAAMADDGPRMSAQRKTAAGIRNSSYAVGQRKQFDSLVGEAAQREELQEPQQPKVTQREAVRAQPNASTQLSTGNTGLSDNLKSGIESLSGMSMDNVKVHYNSAQPAQLNALAYAQGTDIHVAPGQERHLPHEAWHVVQQAQGRVQPTMQMKEGVPVNDDRSLEHEADVMGARAVQMSAMPANGALPASHSPVSAGACVQGWSVRSAWNSVKSVGSGIANAAGSVVDAAGKGLDWAKQKALAPVARYAEDIPGFHLLSVIVGRNPITGAAAERNATNLTRGIMGLVPGGDVLFKQLQESGALGRAFAWFSEQIETLNLGWDTVRGLFSQAWNALSLADVAQPAQAFEKIKAVFAPPLARIRNFAVAVGKKALEFVVEGALNLAGPAGKQVMDIFRRGKETFMLIVSDPIGFARNLINAVVLGVKQFGANIWNHLKKGLTGWLFGTLAGAGLQMPEKFDLKGIVSLVLQILGLTYSTLRKKLGKLIGEKNVARVEKGIEFVTLIATQGIGAAWEKIVEYLGNLKDTVIGAIKDWVVTKIVTAAITKIATMFNPVGAIVQAVISAYNTVMFFIERAKQIMELANSVIESVSQIAHGKVGAAANYVEETMAKTIPVILGFLARLLGLSGLDEKIKKVIETIRGKVDAALDKVAEFIREKAKGLFGSGKDEGAGRTGGAAGMPGHHADEDARKEFIGEMKKEKSMDGKEIGAELDHLKSAYRLEGVKMERQQKTIKISFVDEEDATAEGTPVQKKSAVENRGQNYTWGSGKTSIVGREMEAWLDPADPLQGQSANLNSSQEAMMGAIKSKYGLVGNALVKGHLLNDNLGGKALDNNLYPITKEANGSHLHYAENLVKSTLWESRKGVYYKVAVGGTPDINSPQSTFNITIKNWDPGANKMGSNLASPIVVTSDFGKGGGNGGVSGSTTRYTVISLSTAEASGVAIGPKTRVSELTLIEVSERDSQPLNSSV